MRIAVYVSLVTPLREAQLGGAQAFATDLAEALQARGHEVVIHCAEGSSLPGRRLVTHPAQGLRRALWRPGQDRDSSPPGLGSAFATMLEAIRREGYDAVSAHAFDAESVHAAEGLPVLHTIHLPPPNRTYLEAARSSGASFVTVSRANQRLWRAYGLPQVGVIPNGSPDFGPPPPGLEDEALIAGRVSREKGTDVALRVAGRLGLVPRLAGSVYDRDYWRREVRIRPHSYRRRRLREVMARSRVLLMPVAWDEPFGLVAAEAQLAGCPVAGYRRGGLAEVVIDGEGGYLCAPGDLEALVGAARAAMRLDRSRVRRLALSRLGIGASARAYERQLRQVAEANRKHA